MKILECRPIVISEHASVQFIRIDPENISVTLREILATLMDLSWLKRFDKDWIAQSYQHRAEKTIADIQTKFENCAEDDLTSDAGEYVVSVLAKNALTSQLGYLDIPLGELLDKKTSGNPGFDFHSQNNSTNTVIFGEAKYVAKRSAYPSALSQISEFVQDKKDIDDIASLEHFCSPTALSRAASGFKGFSAAFSAKSTGSDQIIKSIVGRSDFQSLLCYEEVILVAVNL